VYGLIFVSCAVENLFPPSPSDVFVTLAAFLSHQGNYDPRAIFATAWAGGFAGAVAVYLIARRHAERFAGSRLGQALLPPAATAFLRKEYLRYGAAGVFLTRLLPGFRSVVAPFAGLSHLTAAQTLVPVGAALVLWYGALTFIGARLGNQWDAVVGVLDGLNRTLAIIAALAALALFGLVIWWRRRRRRT
jgi:membrane protein DedA with SNARE-associated domain